ncbi:MAG: hypothetical protein AAGD35_04000, partial [Actinomycetota bacterium]
YGILSSRGFVPEMFDDHTLLHPWVADHPDAYRATWLLVGLTQLLLLPVPHAVARSVSTVGATAGHGATPSPAGRLASWAAPFAYIAIGLGLAGAAVFYATNNSLAFAYVDAPDEAARQQVLVVSTAFADVAKEFRLFGQAALAVWLVAVGWVMLTVGRVWSGRLVAAGGVLTGLVVGHKLWFPDSPLEEFWALGLALTYLLIGRHLLGVGLVATVAGQASADRAIGSVGGHESAPGPAA